MCSYYLRNVDCATPADVDYFQQVKRVYSVLLFELVPRPTDTSPLVEDSNDRTSFEIKSGASDFTLDLKSLQLPVNLSSYGAVYFARNLILRYRHHLNNAIKIFAKEDGSQDDVLTASSRAIVALDFVSDAPTPCSIYKMVGIGIHCLYSLLSEINAKDRGSCCSALHSLYNLLRNLKPGDLASEPRPFIVDLMHTLAQLRQSDCTEIVSFAISCMISLAIAYGTPEFIFHVCSLLLDHNVSVSNIPLISIDIPDNLYILYQHAMKSMVPGIFCDWSDADLDSSCHLVQFSLSSTFTPSEWVDCINYGNIASDGRFLYVINRQGLAKIGTGFGETVFKHVYVATKEITSSKDVWIAVSNGAVYVGNTTSRNVRIIDCETLQLAQEVVMPVLLENVPCCDGSSFTVFEADEINCFLTIRLLNDRFALEKTELRVMMGEMKFCVFGDDIDADANLSAIRSTQVDEDNVAYMTFGGSRCAYMTKSGKVFVQNKPVKSDSPANCAYRELPLEEPAEAISFTKVGNVGHRLAVLSKKGHIFVSRNFDLHNYNQRVDSDSEEQFETLKRLSLFSNKQANSISLNNGTLAFTTDNGKVYFFGKMASYFGMSTSEPLIGLGDTFAIKVVLGKTHAVIVTKNGDVFTCGMNYLDQCGRTDGPNNPETNDPGSSSKLDHISVGVGLGVGDGYPPGASGMSVVPPIRLCPPNDHVWLRESATICTACDMCSARGPRCSFAANRSKGSLCGCGSGLSGCVKCGICRSCGIRYNTSGSERDSESDNQAYPVLAPALLMIKCPTRIAIVDVACGNYHTVLRSNDGHAISFGCNRHGQLGVNDIKPHAGPRFVHFGGRTVFVVQVAAGYNHSVLRTHDGLVYTFGKHQNGQLGRQGRTSLWFAHADVVTDVVTTDNTRRIAVWVGASGNTTVVKYRQNILSSRTIKTASIIANKSCYMIFPRSLKNANRYFVIDRRSNTIEVKDCSGLIDGDRLTSPLHHSICLDPVYNVLWLYRSDTQYFSAYFPKIRSSLPVNSSVMFLLNQEYWLPFFHQNCGGTLSQLGLVLLVVFYLLFCKMVSTKMNSVYDKDISSSPDSFGSYHQVSRFRSYGGGWGYALHSVDAVQFSCSQDIKLIGYGLFGGRGGYTAKLKLMKFSAGSSVGAGTDSVESRTEVLAETEELYYECPYRGQCNLFFQKPIRCHMNEWYIAHVTINGPSSDCGSEGQAFCAGDDGTHFTFKGTHISNNGTDVNFGQIPAILFQSVKCDDMSKEESVARLNDSHVKLNDCFFLRVTPSCLTSLLVILKAAPLSSLRSRRSKTSSTVLPLPPPSPEIAEWTAERTAAISLLTLRLTADYLMLLYPVENVKYTEHKESATFAENTFQMVLYLLESIDEKQLTQSFASRRVVDECRSVVTKCFHVFFPNELLIRNFFEHLLQRRIQRHTAGAFLHALCCSAVPITCLFSLYVTRCPYPFLSTCLVKSRKAKSQTTLSFTAVLEYLVDGTFEQQTSGAAATGCSYSSDTCQALVMIIEELSLIGTGCHDDTSFLTFRHTPNRFSRSSSNAIWNNNSGAPDAIAFQVDKSGVVIHGAGIYFGQRTCTYSLELLVNEGAKSEEDWIILEKLAGVLEVGEASGSIAFLKFRKPVQIQPAFLYAFRLCMHSGRSFSGEGGLVTVRGLRDVRFTFSSCSLSLNGTTVARGQIPIILYSIEDQRNCFNYIESGIASEWTLRMTRILVATLQRCLTQELVFNSMTLIKLFSNLFGYLHAFLQNNYSKAQSLITVFDDLLYSLQYRVKSEGMAGSKSENSVRSVLECDHPYEEGTVYSYNVSFKPEVSFMSVEFDAQCYIASEDNLQIYFRLEKSYIPIMKVSGGEKWPKSVLLLPGNQLLFILETTNSKIEKMLKYGFKCLVTGFYPQMSTFINLLEGELLNICSVCCETLVRKSHKIALPDFEVNKYDMKELENEVNDLVHEHAQLLLKGLQIDKEPSIQDVIDRKYYSKFSSPEKRFINDFLSVTPGSAAGALARWLMEEESYVDPARSSLLLNYENLSSGRMVTITVSTKDQNGRVAFAPLATVEMDVNFFSEPHDSVMDKTATAMVRDGRGGDCNGDCAPANIAYSPTYLNKVRYVTITMMKSLQHFSLEELHYARYMKYLHKKSLHVNCNHDGTYVSNWIPEQSGTCKITCRIDGYAVHDVLTIAVENGQVVNNHRLVSSSTLNEAKRRSRVKIATCVPHDTNGVRIRSEPSLQSFQIGLIPPGAAVFFVTELKNSDGVWLKLSEESALTFLSKLNNPNNAWCLQYNAHLKRELIRRESATKIDNGAWGGSDDRRNTISEEDNSSDTQSILIVCDEKYVVRTAESTIGALVRTAPQKSARTFAVLNVKDVLHSNGWLQNSEGIWVQLDLLQHTHLAADPQYSEQNFGYCLVQELDGQVYLESLLSPHVSIAPVSNGGQATDAAGRGTRLHDDNDDDRNQNQQAPSNGPGAAVHDIHFSVKAENGGGKLAPQGASDSGAKVNYRQTRPFITAVRPSVVDSVRRVFAAFIWHENLMYDAIACANYLRFHPDLTAKLVRESMVDEGGNGILAISLQTSVPTAIKLFYKVWREIYFAVIAVVDKHLILPSPPMKIQSPSPSSGGNGDGKSQQEQQSVFHCELCDGFFAHPITLHMRKYHAGCGRPSAGYGYNSSGDFTSGWTGNCGEGGTASTPWYLFCESCRKRCVRTVLAERLKIRRERRKQVRSSLINTEPQNILKSNADFLLQLNQTNEDEDNGGGAMGSVSGGGSCSAMAESPHLDASSKSPCSTRSKGTWVINLYPTNICRDVVHHRHTNNRHDLPLQNGFSKRPNELLKANNAIRSDPGPNSTTPAYMLSIPTSEPRSERQMSLGKASTGSVNSADLVDFRFLTCPSESLKRNAAENVNLLPSHLIPTFRRPVLAFVMQHHNLAKLEDAMHLAIVRCMVFKYVFKVLNWYLRGQYSMDSKMNVLCRFISAMLEDRSNDDSNDDDENCRRHLEHPLKKTVLAGRLKWAMIRAFHSLLTTVADLLCQGCNNKMSFEMLRYCIQSWMFSFNAHDQNLILKSQILITINRIMSDQTNDNVLLENSRPDDEAARTVRYEDLTRLVSVETSSQEPLKDSLLDGSTETFWESGKEDNGKAKTIKVQWQTECFTGFLVSLFIDNVSDEQYHVKKIVWFSSNKGSWHRNRNEVTLASNFCGWTKCLVENTGTVLIELNGPNPSLRVRQLKFLGVRCSSSSGGGYLFKMKQSPSSEMRFSTVQGDAFELLQLIASNAFDSNGLFGHTVKDGKLQQQVLNILLCRNDLQNLQRYVCTQVLTALYVDICSLRERSRRNFSYVCGLMSMLVRIASTSQGQQSISADQHVLTSLSELVLFAPPQVQTQVVVTVEKIFHLFDPQVIDSSLVIVNFLIAIAKSLNMQIRSKQPELLKSVKVKECLDNHLDWHPSTPVLMSVVKSIIRFLSPVSHNQWESIVKTIISNQITRLLMLPVELQDCSTVIRKDIFWLCLAALCVIRSEDWLKYSPLWQSLMANAQDATVYCENHEDGHTVATVYCNNCELHFCSDCGSVLHLRKKNRFHRMQPLPSVSTKAQLVIHETCTRLKLNWIMISVDSLSMNGMADFRHHTQSNRALSECRFCKMKTASELHDVCDRPECVALERIACKKMLPCRHLCGGVANETKCLPCLRCRTDMTLKQDCDDICMICYTNVLSAAPAIQLRCGHVFHYFCCRDVLQRRWPGPRITFTFMCCPVCRQVIDHCALADELCSLNQLYNDVCNKSLLRLQYDGLAQSREVVSPRGEFFGDPIGFATSKYAYYLCFNCKKAYFGGEVQCQAEHPLQNYKEEDLRCGACSDVSQAQICPRHGMEFLEYKCRYCCSIAVFFCFGTTHFCAACHDDFQRLIVIPENELPSCPVGARATQLEGPCPLNVVHPPTGKEFALGCGICRNVRTF